MKDTLTIKEIADMFEGCTIEDVLQEGNIMYPWITFNERMRLRKQTAMAVMRELSRKFKGLSEMKYMHSDAGNVVSAL